MKEREWKSKAIRQRPFHSIIHILHVATPYPNIRMREGSPKSLPCYYAKEIPNSRIAASWRTSFCSWVDTRTYPYVLPSMPQPPFLGYSRYTIFDRQGERKIGIAPERLFGYNRGVGIDPAFFIE